MKAVSPWSGRISRAFRTLARIGTRRPARPRGPSRPRHRARDLPEGRRRPPLLPVRVERGRREVGPLQLHRHRRARDLPGARRRGRDPPRRRARSVTPWRRTEARTRSITCARCSRSCAPVPLPDLPRFSGGAVGYVSYDWVRYVERLPETNPDPLGVPDCWFVLPETVLVHDRTAPAALDHPRRRDPRRASRSRRRTSADCAQLDRVERAARRADAAPARGRGSGPRRSSPSRTSRASASSRWSSAARSTSTRATSSRSCRRSASRSRRRSTRSDLPRSCASLNPVAVLVLHALRRARRARLVAGDPRAAHRRPDRAAPARRHRAARRDAGGGHARSSGACSPIRRSSPST